MRRRIISIMLALLGVLGMAGAASSALALSPAAPTSSRDSILFIGMSGVSPSDLNLADPQLATLLENYSLAALSPRSVSPLTCPSEGWMQLRTSRDVSDRLPETYIEKYGDDCHAATIIEDPASLPKTQPQPVHIRNFTQHIEKTQWPQDLLFSHDVVAIGTNATIPVASNDGSVQQWYALPDGGDPANAAKAQRELTRILQTSPGDVVADIGSVRGAPRYLDVPAQTKLIEQKLINILTANNNADHPRTVIIASMADQWRRAHLHFFATNMAINGHGGPSVLESDLTRATGFITAADVRNLLTGKLTGLHVQPEDSLTSALQPVLDIARHSSVAASSSAKWYQVFNIVVLLGASALTAVFLIKPQREGLSWGGPRWIWIGLEKFNLWAFAWVPAAMILNFLPWWNLPGGPGMMQTWAIGATSVIAGGMVACAHLTPHRAGFIALVATVILSLDIVAGSPHQRNGFMGSLILTSRRYYGISNRTYLILVVGGLVGALLIIAYLRRRASSQRSVSDGELATHDIAALPWGSMTVGQVSAYIISAVGLLMLAVDAMPGWGADFGGPPGIIAGFGIAALLVAGKKLRWWHVLAWILLTVAVMSAVGFVDVARGGQSHIGRFWSRFGSTDSWAIVGGKIRDVVRSFVGRPDLLILIAVVIIFAIAAVYATSYLNSRSGVHLASLREITAGYGFLPVAAGIAAGIFIAVPINDSGAIMIKEGLYIALPALAAMIAGQAAKRS
ncbi:hypothetical protein [Arcanobacterium pinnipediorum]|uniref:Uncharacterized protein n=1 Tax=Arcanobacterium pinnipediorum TaxID=1503041 RepID=A0ABY5AHZ4_9ACTO|nr:hypothetical protein [Arcanobacterium pinnipediorum]USR79346.1 hypothetical protein NG665_08230 [Arcanobacterium pinnipediorum]